MATALAFVAVVLAAAAAPAAVTAATLTIHNLCPHPVWPLVTPNAGSASISDNRARLDPNGLMSVSFPAAPWAGRVAARTGCDPATASSCETGESPPATVAQLSVHGGGDLAAYSVSLVDGFNVPMVVSPQAVGGGQCPVLGCTVDLNCDCPPGQRVSDGAACRGPPEYFKNRCQLTRTTPTDVEPVPQSCRAPGELKVVFCQATMAAADMLIRTVVAAADS
ncbi:osmotin-like protein [Oryza brachyantha]|uniref:osmotin-like protein n=1 Tax=Oryza brachyantha TaxID=4533 RepID=UPI001ADC193F|nr:osmotin-like protein [Oryza brachyantha]